MKRASLRLAVLLLVAGATARPAAGAGMVGLIPLQLTDATPSYLGVRLAACMELDLGERGSQDAQLPVTNDGGAHSPWESSLPLEVLAATALGDVTEVLVTPRAFDLKSPAPWRGSCGTFSYTVRLNPAVSQPVSLLYLANGRDGLPPLFAGTLYVAVVLRMANLGTAEVSELWLDLALNPSGKWTAADPASLPDSGLSTALLFAETDGQGDLKDSYSCVTETHPYGLFCLRLSASLMSALEGH